MELEVISVTDGNKSLGFLNVNEQTSIREIRTIIHAQLKGPSPQQQLLRLDVKNGRPLNDNETVESLKLTNRDKIYVKDTGRQISWRQLFIIEYLGALLIYQRFYSKRDAERCKNTILVHIAAICITLHYVKRLYETLYVHRFSRDTIPLQYVYKHCAYWWIFTAFTAWEINDKWSWYHPRGGARVFWALVIFLLSEYGNYSVHLVLRDLRRSERNERRIPMPNDNIFTQLFNFVSFPNYTYETIAWFAFAMMTLSLFAFLFACISAYQMSQLALAKHRKYLKDFRNYPSQRRAIFPFVL